MSLWMDKRFALGGAKGDTSDSLATTADSGSVHFVVAFEEKPNVADGSFQAGLVAPLGVQGRSGLY